MTPSPPEDRRLVAFLKAHQPTPPCADDRTEMRLMARVVQERPGELWGDRRRSWPWLPSLMAASLAIALPLGGTHLVRRGSPPPTQHTTKTQELASLNDFLWESWGGMVGYGTYGPYSAEGQVYASDLLFD